MPAALTRQIALPTSSAISNAPSAACANPTGAPNNCFSSAETNPVTTGCGAPAGLPSANGTWTTWKPLTGERFQLPCSLTKAPLR